MGGDIIPPVINAQLHYLLTNSPFSIKVEQMWSGSRNPALIDRFTLLVPFCLDYVKWNVIYNAQNPLIAPDVIFGPDDDGFRPYQGDGDTKLTKNSLSDWNYKDPTRLLCLILELRDAYATYQKRRVAEVDDERVKFETSTVISKEGIEMYLSSGLDKSEEVRYAIPLLGMDINKFVVGCSWQHPQKIYLQVIFPVARKFSASQSAPCLKLVSSPEMKALFSIDDFRLPPWLDGMCMAEYLPTLEDLLALQIRDAVLSIEVRRKFILALALVFGRPVEADPVFCRKATFLVASGVFSCLVHFTLPNQFPKQKPLLVLQSSQHFDSRGAPIKSALLTEYPWSPRWEAPEMAERIFDFLVDECLNFKKYCTEIVLHQR